MNGRFRLPVRAVVQTKIIFWVLLLAGILLTNLRFVFDLAKLRNPGSPVWDVTLLLSITPTLLIPVLGLLNFTTARKCRELTGFLCDLDIRLTTLDSDEAAAPVPAKHEFTVDSLPKLRQRLWLLLDNYREASFLSINDLILKTILHGTAEEMSSAAAEENSIGKILSSRYLLVYLLPEKFKDKAARSWIQDQKVLFEILPRVLDKVGISDTCYHYYLWEGCLLVLRLSKIREKMKGPGSKLAYSLYDRLKRRGLPRFSLGYTRNPLKGYDLSALAEAVRKAAFMRYLKGPAAITSVEELDSLGPVHYPRRDVDHLIEAAFLGDRREYLRSARAVLETISGSEYHKFLRYAELCLVQIRDELLRRSGSKVAIPDNVSRAIEEPTFMMYRTQFRNMLIEIYKSVEAWQVEAGSIRDTELIQAARDFIADNSGDPGLCAAMIAEELKVSEDSFMRKFRSIEGQSLHVYINTIRLEKIGELLESTSLSVKELSRQAGFNNYPYFFTLFKKYYGMTPTQYRRLHVIDNND